MTFDADGRHEGAGPGNGGDGSNGRGNVDSENIEGSSTQQTLKNGSQEQQQRGWWLQEKVRGSCIMRHAIIDRHRESREAMLPWLVMAQAGRQRRR